MKALKVTAITLLAVIAAGAAALFVGIPAGFLLTPLLDNVRTDAGYDIKIAGSKLTLLPTPTIELNGISLRDLASTAAEPAIAAESLRASVTLQTLFGDRPRVTEIIVVKPVARAPLIRQRTTAPTQSAEPGKSVIGPLPEFTIDHFAVHGGTVQFVTASNRVESTLDNVELIGSLAEGGALDAILSAQSEQQALRVTLKGQAPKGGFDGRPLPLNFTFEAPGLLEGALTGSAEVRATKSLIRFNNINGAIAANRFNGWAAVDVSDKPLVKVELDFQKLDIGTVRPAGSGTGAPANDIDRPWSDTPINLESLNYVDAEVQLSAAAFNAASFHFAPLAINATLNNGIVRAAFSQMGIYGGQATGGFAADVTRPTPSYAVAMNIAGMRALPLLTDIADFTTIDGTLVLNVDLRAWGQSQRAIMSSLDGTLSFLVQNGEIRSVNIAQMIRNVGSAILSGWQAGTTEKTDFTQFGGGFRFQNGQAYTNNLQLLGPLVRVTGSGSADIGAKTLNFKLEPKLVMSLEGQGGAASPTGLGVPVAVQGSWGQPKIYPEFAGMLDNPDAAFTKLKELGLGLFGNSASPQAGSSNSGAAGAGSSGQQSNTGAGAAGGAGALIQGIGDVLKNLGTNSPGGPPSTSTPPAGR